MVWRDRHASGIVMARCPQSLRCIRLFRQLSDEEIRRLDAQCLWRRYEAKEEVVGYGEPGTDVFFVVSGLVRALIRTDGIRDVILGDIAGGEFFGELAAIDSRPRSASVVAMTGATLARMSASLFHAAVRQYADVCGQLLVLLAARVRALDNRVSELATLDVRHRLFAELLRISRPDNLMPGRAFVSPPPYHAEIAARISARREAVTRELRALESAGLLERRRGALVLTDIRALVALFQDPRRRTV
jgi:CRP/FNR family cyclic AMP-dependent transcriptional regulator